MPCVILHRLQKSSPFQGGRIEPDFRLDVYMIRKKKFVFLILLFIGALYFFIFWFPNATGARDQNMLSVFSADEIAQYPYMVRMLGALFTLFQSPFRFFAYQQYFYGFPYYFYSVAAALLPLKLLGAAGSVSTNMLFLRQLVSVLPMVIALILLVYLQTGFESYIKSISLFLILILIPEVVANDMWLHPESLEFLLIVLTLFFLTRDDLKFGKSFYIAALFCGLATATKLLGLFFFLTIPLYIFLGWYQKRISLRKVMQAATFFVAIMAVIFVLSNPFLFWASQRAFALKIQSNFHRSMTAGFTVAYKNSPLVWLQVIFDLYSVPAFLILAMTALIIGMLKGERRLINLLILSWAIPFMLYISFAIAIRPKHFPMPILLPVFSALPAYFTVLTPPRFIHPLSDYLKKHSARLVLFCAGILIVGWQFVYSLNMDIPQYLDTLNREKNSPSLNFYAALDKNDLSRIILNRTLIVFRDVAVYVPDAANDKVDYQWGVSGYGYINKINADLLLLSKQHLRDYTQPGQTAFDSNFTDAVHFYKDALADQVRGYTLIYQDDFGMAYLSTPLYNQFFSTH